MAKIPANAPPDVQQAFRELWAAVASWIGGALNIDLKGRRIINAGRAIAPSDYVTLEQAEALRGDQNTSGKFLNIEVQQQTRLQGPVFVAQLQDAGIVFCSAGGRLTTDEENFSWRYSNKSLRIDEAAIIRWHHRIEMTSPATGVLVLSGEDQDVTNQFARIVGGLADTSSPAWSRSSAAWEAKLGDASAYTAVRASRFDGNAATSSNPAWIPSGANWSARLGDDSAYTKVLASQFIAGAAAVGNPMFKASGNDWHARLGDDSGYTEITALKFNVSAPATYSESNVTTDRTFDADTVAVAELADIVGTLIQDLRAAGLVA